MDNVAIVLGLGLVGIVLAYLFSQIKYEEEDEKNANRDVGLPNFNMVWTRTLRIFMFILTLLDVLILVWYIYLGTEGSVKTTTLTQTTVINATLNITETNSTVTVDLDNSYNDIVNPYFIGLLLMVSFISVMLFFYTIIYIILAVMEMMRFKGGGSY